MSQNRSHAVMAQRHEAPDSFDDFPTPAWATRALIEHVIRPNFPLGESCWEPACNRGFMARVLKEYFPLVRAADVFDYGGNAVADYLLPYGEADFFSADWTITNPPFRLAEQFIAKARRTSKIGCAMLVRTVFLESTGRYLRLFREDPPTAAAIFSERVPMVKGRVDQSASTATSYSWLAWVRGEMPRPTMWIPPCRAQLERSEDYIL